MQVHTRQAEIGSLDLWCSGPYKHRCNLQFDVGSVVHTDREAHIGGTAEAEGIVDQKIPGVTRVVLARVFGANSEAKPSGLVCY